MKSSGVRWTLALMAALSALAIAGAAYRSGEEEKEPPARKAPPPPVRSYGGVEIREETPAVVPETPPPPAPPPRPVEPRAPRNDGYREAREASYEGTLSGQVVTPEGPATGMTVRVEWMLAQQPARDEIVKLKRIGARRERDGSWWAHAMASTDESGCFTLEGLPAVPLRIHAGSTVQQAQVGSFARISTERPQ
jgi:hypothetical protein